MTNPLYSQGSPSATTRGHAIRARNISVNHENAIHNDQGARDLGFRGGLVSGVTVYAYMTRVLAVRFGADALVGTVQRAAFFGPVYDGDSLRLASQPESPESLSPAVAVHAYKAGPSGADEAVAVWEVERTSLPAPGPLPDWSPRAVDAERPVVAWEAIHEGEPFHGFLWEPGAEDHRAWCVSVEDDLPLYSKGEAPLCHPGWVLQQANFAFGREFRMNPWIHVSSRLTWHAPIRVGQRIEVRAVPLQTWVKGGDKYVRLRVVLAERGQPLLEVDHKAIVEVARR